MPFLPSTARFPNLVSCIHNRKRRCVSSLILKLNSSPIFHQILCVLASTTLREVSIASFGTTDPWVRRMRVRFIGCHYCELVTNLSSRCIAHYFLTVYMDISNNEFNFQLPESIGDTLPNLEIFFAENNKLIGNIPASLGNLNLCTCTDCDPLSQSKFNCHDSHCCLLLLLVTFALIFVLSTVKLELDNNQLTGKIPPLSGCTNMRK